MAGDKKREGGDSDRHRDHSHDQPDEKRGAGAHAGSGHVHGPHCGCGHDHADADSNHSHGSAARAEVPDYPTEVTFKAVFRNLPYTIDTLRGLCREAGIDAAITDRGSSKGNFISYTVTAVFPSDEALRALCTRIGQVEGFFTMF